MKAINDNAIPRFAELCGRSCFSFLEGASHPEEMVTHADALGLDALALCDRDGLYGMARAHAEAKGLHEGRDEPGAPGVRLIVGAELTLEGAHPDEQHPDELWPRVMLLVEDHDGYSNLCRLLTTAHADHEKGDAGISVGEVAEHAQGLTVVVPSIDRRWAKRDALWSPLRDAFGDRLTAATWRHMDGRDGERTEAAELAHRRYAAPVVATARPLYHHASRKPLSDVMYCIRNKTTLDAAGTALGINAEARLRSAAQMLMLFRDRPEWVRATLPVAQRCRFTMDELRYRFPSDELCLDRESPDEALRRLTEEGCQARYPRGTPRSVREQIEKELRLIADLDVAPYFLSVHQIVVLARRRGILCQGRGSAANSAVCFVLGVTAVDPARSNLLFERFLSAERAEPPDIDVDFEHERREEVIQELYEIYGRDRAAMVSEIIAYRGKSAVREVGKAFGLSLDQVDRLSRIVMRYDAAEVDERRVIEQGLDPLDERLREVVALARSLEGFPRHLSIHVGGFVLSADPLDRIAPVEPARMEGRTVVPWDKDDLDTLGFFKVDVLGLGMLTAIRKTLELIHRGPRAKPLRPELEGASFDPIEALAAIPPEDPRVYDAIGRADTVGVFQIESRAQMAMLPRLKPRCFYDLVIEVAIVRPGPIQGGMVHPYLKRRTGDEPAVAPHRCLESILERTLGVPLFQEQVMQIAMVGAGYTAGEADQLRRDMAAWKKHGRLERHRPKLLAGFARQGISAEFGEKLYQQVQGFGEYGFPESHAASFALLVYASSWLKVHHQAAFTCSLLNAQPMGFYSASSLVQDAQRHGVVIAPACIARSDWHNTLEPDDASKGGLRLRLGFRQIKGIREAAGLAIERARREAPFADMVDLVRRTGLKKNEVEAFAEAGALEVLVAGRREALWQAHAPRVEGLFEGLEIERRGGAGPDEQLSLPTLAPSEQLVLDYSRVGLSISDHPMRYIRRRLPPEDSKYVSRARDLRRLKNGQSVSMAGMVIGRQRPMTASGVTFFSLEDETGVANLIVQPHVFDQHHLVARHAKFLWVKGRLERQGEVVHLLVFQMKRLDYPSARSIETRSRDFH